MSSFDPLSYPYQRAQTYVDGNPPEVLADEFYNPTQDALAYLFGAFSGYSASLSYEEFVLPSALSTPVTGNFFGAEMAVLTNPTGAFQFASIDPAPAGGHGVYHVDGLAAGNRGGGTAGFQVEDAPRYVDTRRWIYRARVRCSNFTTVADSPTGLVFGLGPINGAPPLPSWVADSGGFWVTFWDTGATITAIPTVNDEWVTLWIADKDADGTVRWYLKRDTDPLPLLLDTQALGTPSIVNAKRYFRYLVKMGAAAVDSLEIDSMSFLVER